MLNMADTKQTQASSSVFFLPHSRMSHFENHRPEPNWSSKTNGFRFEFSLFANWWCCYWIQDNEIQDKFKGEIYIYFTFENEGSTPNCMHNLTFCVWENRIAQSAEPQRLSTWSVVTFVFHLIYISLASFQALRHFFACCCLSPTTGRQ